MSTKDEKVEDSDNASGTKPITAQGPAIENNQDLKGTHRYEHVRELGVGGFGIVEAAIDRTTGCHVAIKTIQAAKVHSEAKRLVRELDIMIKLKDRHPNVMTICDGYVSYPNPTQEDTFDVHIVMPLMRGDLHRFTREFSRLPVQQANRGQFYASIAVVFAFHTAFGLDYLHRSNIVHRDLKPDNIMVNIDINDVYSSSAVIGDMGLARAVSPTETFYICTRQYRPPEVITNTATGDATLDIWSLGCVYYELVTGHTLFHLPSSLENGQWVGAKASYQLEEVLNIIGTPTEHEIEQMPACNVKSYLMKTRKRDSRLRGLFEQNFRLSCDDEERMLWFQLIAACLQYFPQKRPTASQVCSSPLFQRYNILFGENVHQYQAVEYMGGATSEVRRENKHKIKELLHNTEFQASTKVHFPPLQTPALADQFRSVPIATVDDVQNAINMVTEQLKHEGSAVSPSASATPQTAVIEDLRLLLNFFVALLPVPPTGENDTVPTPAVGNRQ